VVTNDGNQTMTAIDVAELSFSGTGLPPVISCPAISTLSPGDSFTCTASYESTAADVDAGVIDNTAVVSAAPAATPFDVMVFGTSSATVTAPSSAAISLVKSAALADAASFAAGATIAYTFVVTNTGNVTLSDVAVDERAFTGTGTAPVVSCPAAVASLAPQAEAICTADYTVTAADAAAGSVSNTAVATGDPPGGGARVSSSPASAVVPFASQAALSLRKTGVASAGAIDYSFEVRNTGDVAIGDVSVDETAFDGAGSAPQVTCPDTVLPPGASVTCSASHPLSDAELAGAVISNTAVATAVWSGGSVRSNASTATVAVGALPDTGSSPAPGLIALSVLLCGGGLLAVIGLRRRLRERR